MKSEPETIHSQFLGKLHIPALKLTTQEHHTNIIWSK